MRIRKEAEKEWGEWGNVLSAGEVDPLTGLRFKFEKKRNIYLWNQAGDSRNEMPGARKEITKEETYNKYGGRGAKIEIEAIENMTLFARIPFAKTP